MFRREDSIDSAERKKDRKKEEKKKKRKKEEMEKAYRTITLADMTRPARFGSRVEAQDGFLFTGRNPQE